jgi:hypothetical protein
VRVAAGLLALVAVICLVVAVADMVSGTDVGRRGWVLRAVALACFVCAVVLNVLAR